jgi:hypothetical protein
MAETGGLGDLIRELTTLAILGARQSSALGTVLLARGLVTQEELDQAMSSTLQMTEKLRSAAERYGHGDDHH